MGCVALLLLPCFLAPFTTTVALIFMLPILMGFMVDWLVVSGRLTTPAYTRIFSQRLTSYNSIIFQPIVRTALGIAVLLLVSDNYFSNATATYFALFATAMVLLGFAGRIGAIAILLLVGLTQGDDTMNALILVIITCGTSVMLLGTGHFSVWQWDDRWVNRRDGEETE
jgi:CDP-diacylglycerol--glycerol-3-phosphate 3-phosphatidyltransferase